VNIFLFAKNSGEVDEMRVTLYKCQADESEHHIRNGHLIPILWAVMFEAC